jgi:tetratricopeptide (TPR) repeat protein
MKSLLHAGLKGWLDRKPSGLKEGERQLELGNYADAEKHLIQADGEVKTRSAAEKTRARILLALGTAQWHQKKLSEARQSVEDAVRLLDEGSPSGMEKAECLDLLGRVRLGEGDSTEAERLFRESIELERRGAKPNPLVLGPRLHRLALALSESGRVEQATEALEEAVALTRAGVGEEHKQGADLMYDLGGLHQAAKRHGDALECLGRALETHQRVCGQDSDEVARDYQQLAAASRAAGDLEQAVSYYEKALYIRERQLGATGPDIALLKMGLSDVQVAAGRYSAGLEAMQQAVLRLEYTRDGRLAATLENLAGLYTRCGQYENAMSCLIRARAIWDEAPEEHTAELAANHDAITQVIPYMSEHQMDSLAASINPSYRNTAVARRTGAEAEEASEFDGATFQAEAPTFRSPAGGDVCEDATVSVFRGPAAANVSGGAPVNPSLSDILNLIMGPGSGSHGRAESPASETGPVRLAVRPESPALNGWDDLAFDEICGE